MEKIYILHQYYDVSHFKALYECGHEYGFEVADYIVADNWFIIKNLLKKLLKKKGITIKEALVFFKKKYYLRKLKNEILIVGLAPYDPLLFKYEKIIKSNRSFYFSSWQEWDGTSFPRGKLKYKNKWEMILTNCFQGAACVSEKTQYGVHKFISNTKVVNHAVPINEYCKKSVFENDKSFLFIGRFEDAKNIEYILRWARENRKENITISFAGFGKYQEEIVKLEQEDNRIKCLGMLSKNELKKSICNYSFTLLPSKIEPFGIVLIESLASGTPCITSNASGPSEIITDKYNGLVCDKDSYESFSEVIERAICLSDFEYKQMCENALKSGKKYSSEAIVTKWVSLITEIEDRS